MSEITVVVSRVKKLAHNHGVRASEEFIEALSKHIEEVVEFSAVAARNAEMSTIKARHFSLSKPLALPAPLPAGEAAT